MDLGSIWGDFFRGEVRYVNAGLINSKYVITLNSSIVKVQNSTHIKLIPNQYDYPDTFEIIAPLDAVTLVSGNIPSDYIHNLPASIYLSLREKHLGV